jgi:hypothetical protein
MNVQAPQVYMMVAPIQMAMGFMMGMMSVTTMQVPQKMMAAQILIVTEYMTEMMNATASLVLRQMMGAHGPIPMKMDLLIM